MFYGVQVRAACWLLHCSNIGLSNVIPHYFCSMRSCIIRINHMFSTIRPAYGIIWFSRISWKYRQEIRPLRMFTSVHLTMKTRYVFISEDISPYIIIQPPSKLTFMVIHHCDIVLLGISRVFIFCCCREDTFLFLHEDNAGQFWTLCRSLRYKLLFNQSTTHTSLQLLPDAP